MQRITIDVFDENDGHLNGLIEINGKDFTFADIGTRYGGLQSKHDGDNTNHKLMQKHLFAVAGLIEEIIKLNK